MSISERPPESSPEPPRSESNALALRGLAEFETRPRLRSLTVPRIRRWKDESVLVSPAEGTLLTMRFVTPVENEWEGLVGRLFYIAQFPVEAIAASTAWRYWGTPKDTPAETDLGAVEAPHFHHASFIFRQMQKRGLLEIEYDKTVVHDGVGDEVYPYAAWVWGTMFVYARLTPAGVETTRALVEILNKSYAKISPAWVENVWVPGAKERYDFVTTTPWREVLSDPKLVPPRAQRSLGTSERKREGKARVPTTRGPLRVAVTDHAYHLARAIFLDARAGNVEGVPKELLDAPPPEEALPTVEVTFQTLSRWKAILGKSGDLHSQSFLRLCAEMLEIPGTTLRAILGMDAYSAMDRGLGLPMAGEAAGFSVLENEYVSSLRRGRRNVVGFKADLNTPTFRYWWRRFLAEGAPAVEKVPIEEAAPPVEEVPVGAAPESVTPPPVDAQAVAVALLDEVLRRVNDDSEATNRIAALERQLAEAGEALKTLESAHLTDLQKAWDKANRFEAEVKGLSAEVTELRALCTNQEKRIVVLQDELNNASRSVNRMVDMEVEHRLGKFMRQMPSSTKEATP